MIEVSNLVKDFGKKRALDSLSFNVKPASAFGLLGRNGAGKTTCVRIIMDVFPADSGDVTIDGARPSKSGKNIGYLPEERGLYHKKTVIEQMVYFGKLRGLTGARAKQNATALLERLDAAEYTNKQTGTLSKGNQQKIQLAIALINEPDIIILDEPFSGLDPINAKLLKELVTDQTKQGKTVIFSSHQMSAVEEFCDDICIIDKGRAVLSGNLREIKKTYPRDNIYIEAEDADVNLSQTVSAIELNAVEQKGAGVIVTLKQPSQRAELLRVLADKNVGVSAFTVMEPSLEDIFIEKVGGEIEAV